ncbi:hypothetical protein D3C71_1948730 [compost metagenome]
MEDLNDFIGSLSDGLRIIVHRSKFLTESIELIDYVLSIIGLQFHRLGNTRGGYRGFINGTGSLFRSLLQFIGACIEH